MTTRPRKPVVVDARVIDLGANTLVRLRALRRRTSLTESDGKRAADGMIAGLLRDLQLGALAEEWETFGG